MPEGDTLYKVAAYMRPRMVGSYLIWAQAGHAALTVICGRRICDVRAVGKHLIIDFNTQSSTDSSQPVAKNQAWHLRVHLGLHGSWHVYHQGEPWKRPTWQACVTLNTSTHLQFVCFNAQDVELLRPDEINTTAVLSRLGPNLLDASCDLQAVLRRARRQNANTLMVDTLLNQNVAAGLGNVYKSELLFLFRLHPQTLTHQVHDGLLQNIFARARVLMQQNVGGWPRTTTYNRSATSSSGYGLPRPRLYVYRRQGEACLACGAVIVWARLGKRPRGTYWCPHCQRPNEISPSLSGAAPSSLKLGSQRPARRRGCGPKDGP